MKLTFTVIAAVATVIAFVGMVILAFIDDPIADIDVLQPN